MHSGSFQRARAAEERASAQRVSFLPAAAGREFWVRPAVEASAAEAPQAFSVPAGQGGCDRSAVLSEAALSARFSLPAAEKRSIAAAAQAELPAQADSR